MRCSLKTLTKQQWVVVESEQRKQADLKTLSNRIEQDFNLKKKSLLSLEKKAFACEPDALSATLDFEKTLNYHALTEVNIVAKPHYKRKGRPRPEDKATHYTYHIHASLVEDEAVIQTYRNQAGRFILATNLLDEKSGQQTLYYRSTRLNKLLNEDFVSSKILSFSRPEFFSKVPNESWHWQ